MPGGGCEMARFVRGSVVAALVAVAGLVVSAGHGLRGQPKDGASPGGTWKMRSDGTLNGKIDKDANEGNWKVRVKGEKFTADRGKEAEKGNEHSDHVMEGEIQDGTNVVVVIRQRARISTPWVRTYVGQLKDGVITGSFFDNDKGVKGDFEFRLVK
jgi:hypothetical protein